MKPYYETPEYFREWRRKNPDKAKAIDERRSAKQRLPENVQKRKDWYKANKAAISAKWKERYKNDPEFRAKAIARAAAVPKTVKAERKARQYRKDPVRWRKASMDWYYKRYDHCQKRNAAYRAKTRQHHRAYSRSRSAEITDGYAREMLSKYSTISARDWPQALVDAKKLEIACMRLTGDRRYKALPETTVNKIKNP